MKLDALRANVPNGADLDRLLRAEASVERGIERTMAQLERLQRIDWVSQYPPCIVGGRNIGRLDTTLP
jgi:hypothetical protein